MKLNPTKCTFGVQEGRFLRYYITNEGIQPNPDKVKEFIGTTEPRSLKVMQALKETITALERFIALSVD